MSSFPLTIPYPPKVELSGPKLAGGPCGVMPEAALQIFTPYGGIVKKFKFLKEVKFL